MKNPSEILQLHYDHDESKRIRALIKENFDKRNWRYSDEETFEDLVERSKNILDHLLNNHLEQNVLCISHGTIIKMIVSRDVFGEKLTSSVFWEFRHHTWQANTGLTHLEHTEKHGWVLISWNDTTHL